MAKTILDQLATNRALYDAARGGQNMGNVSAGQALLSAALIESQYANAQGYSYSGRSYGSFVGNTDPSSMMDAAFILQKGTVSTEKAMKQAKYTAGVVRTSGSYSYAGGSYGRFVDQEEEANEAMRVAQVLDGGNGAGGSNDPATDAPAKAGEEKGVMAFLKKYKLWVIAAICTALYFVLRKK